jgi:hypothetical protein
MDFSKPDITQGLASALESIRDAQARAATWYRPAVVDVNIPEGACRYAGVAKRFERFVGGAWIELAVLYEMTVRRAENLAGYLPSVAAALNTVPVRNSAGAVEGNITGNAATAAKLATARSISATGDVTTGAAQSFDGSENVALPLVLAATGVTAGAYGGNTKALQITVDAKGRLTAASAVDIAFPVASFNNRTGAVALSTADVLGVLPSLSGKAGMSLRVNSGATGVEWGSAGVTSVSASVVATNPEPPVWMVSPLVEADKINSISASISGGSLTITLSITHIWTGTSEGGGGE